MKPLFLLFSFLTFSGIVSSDAQKLLTIDKENFQVTYPETWKIDTADEDYDPDAFFSINSPDDGGAILIMIFDATLDPEVMIKEQVEEIKKEVIKKPTSVTSFDTWGKYKGNGVIVKGKILGIFKGSIIMFAYTHNDKTLMITEQHNDSDGNEVLNGFKTIADSFTFK